MRNEIFYEILVGMLYSSPLSFSAVSSDRLCVTPYQMLMTIFQISSLSSGWTLFCREE